MTLISMFRTQHRKTVGTMYLGALCLNSAHLELMGLMVMAWKTLRRQVVAMDTPLPVCEHRKQVCIQNL